MEIELEEFRKHIDQYMALGRTMTIRIMKEGHHVVDLTPQTAPPTFA